jgi:type IV secretory pathway TrbD component
MPSHEPIFHPVYKALIQRPHLWGVDQRFVGVSPALMFVIFLLGGFSLPAFGLGLVAMIACHLAGRWMYRHEPQILPMLWRAWPLKGRYDPLKHEPVYVQVRKQW